MFQRILRLVIEHRLAVIVVSLVCAGLGALALTRLPIDAVPDITNNQVVINTACPGYGPEEVEKQITFPLETALAGIPYLQSTRSLSRNEFSQITAIFDDGANIYFLRQLVQERILGVKDRLPRGVEPVMGPTSTGLGEVLMWVVDFEHPDQAYTTPAGRVLDSPDERAMYLRELQEWVIRPPLRAVPGVADVDSIGGYSRQFVVEVDQAQLASLGLTLEILVRRLEQSNQNTGAGFIEVQGQNLTVRALGRLHNERDIESVVIAEKNGSPIHVADVATVRLGRELRTGSATENGHEVVIGTALMRIGENSRVVAQAVKKRLTKVSATLPKGVVARIVLDRTQLVDATIDTVKRNLTEGAILVILVLFVILGNFRAALLTALAIPLSMLYTAIGMVGLNMSGNLMSLGAIDFGLIVDGSVIIVENSVRVLAEEQQRLGRTLSTRERLDAVYHASCAVRNATAFGEAIIILVYIPVLFLTGVEGKMFQPMAMTVILALTAAFVLSLTFIPAMVAMTLTGNVAEREVRWLERLRNLYTSWLARNLRRPWPALVLSAVCLFLSLAVFNALGQEFVPTLDEQNLAMQAQRPAGTGVEEATRLQEKLEKLVLEFPQIAVVFSKTGTADLASDPMPPNFSDTFLILKPRQQWPDPGLDKAELVEQLEARVTQLPGHNYEFTQPIQMRFNELISGVRGDVAVKVFGDDFTQLGQVANQIAEVLNSVPGAKDVRVEQLTGLPSLTVEPNFEVLGRFGLTVEELHTEVAAAIRGRETGYVFEGDRRFPIVIRLPEQVRSDPDALRRLPIQIPVHEMTRGQAANSNAETNPHQFVPLRDLADVKQSLGINQVSRENGKRRVVVQCNVRGRDLGSFVAEAQDKIARQVQLPAGDYLVWGGQYENLAQAKARLQLVVPACLVMILLFLYSSFGSIRLALLVFVGVPLALPGGVFALWLRGLPFSISAAVGFIALSGVAVLNGLVLVTFIEELRRSGHALDEAVREGCSLRFRPILMTALVAALGFIPMALSTGTGAEVQRPLATVVIGGLCTTTPLILFLLPSLYLLTARWRTSRPSADVAPPA